MAARMLSMRKIKEVLRLRFEHGIAIRKIAQRCRIGHGTVKEYLVRARWRGRAGHCQKVSIEGLCQLRGRATIFLSFAGQFAGDVIHCHL
jgi:hypothetical protein